MFFVSVSGKVCCFWCCFVAKKRKANAKAVRKAKRLLGELQWRLSAVVAQMTGTCTEKQLLRVCCIKMSRKA